MCVRYCEVIRLPLCCFSVKFSIMMLLPIVRVQYRDAMRLPLYCFAVYIRCHDTSIHCVFGTVRQNVRHCAASLCTSLLRYIYSLRVLSAGRQYVCRRPNSQRLQSIRYIYLLHVFSTVRQYVRRCAAPRCTLVITNITHYARLILRGNTYAVVLFPRVCQSL